MQQSPTGWPRAVRIVINDDVIVKEKPEFAALYAPSQAGESSEKDKILTMQKAVFIANIKK